LVGSTIPEEDLLPEPHWLAVESDRQPQKDEVFASRVLLSENLFCFLDDGERIRVFDPNQPAGDRLINIPVRSVTPGTYLLLREDQNKQGALYEEALDTFGLEKQQIIKSQRLWKDTLRKKLLDNGAQVENTLKNMGVQAVDRVEEWVDMIHIMPQKDSDFQLLLQFLGIEQRPAFEYAKQLRNKCQELGWKMRHDLETELSQINSAGLQKLRQNGYFEQQAENPLYRNIVIVRVLAISPNREIVARQKTRVLFEDKMNSAKWLE
jgi:REP element-mobilizing transposase RayT